VSAGTSSARARHDRRVNLELEEVLVSIVCGFDVHRDQITFDLVDRLSGEVRTGRLVPATRAGLRRWLASVDASRLVVAVEATTGWRFVVEELQRAGARAVLAEPADTRALRGPKRSTCVLNWQRQGHVVGQATHVGHRPQPPGVVPGLTTPGSSAGRRRSNRHRCAGCRVVPVQGWFPRHRRLVGDVAA
jgi:hypothetical protein